VNTSRGEIVDEAALVDALVSGHLGGAGIDTFSIEPLPADHPFRTLPNVIATPHIGYVTEATYRMFFEQTVENVIAWLDRRPIRIVTEQVWGA
jgi:phosphoglycerate dehydrogenase-like enzyme